MGNKIDYKFYINDEVFFMDNNKVVSGKVGKVTIEIDKNVVLGEQTRTRIKYTITYKPKNSDYQHCSKDEDMLFESKSKLIDSL